MVMWSRQHFVSAETYRKYPNEQKRMWIRSIQLFVLHKMSKSVITKCICQIVYRTFKVQKHVHIWSVFAKIVHTWFKVKQNLYKTKPLVSVWVAWAVFWERSLWRAIWRPRMLDWHRMPLTDLPARLREWTLLCFLARTFVVSLTYYFKMFSLSQKLVVPVMNEHKMYTKFALSCIVQGTLNWWL